MLVNDEWITKWPNSILKGSRRTLSDHCPIYIQAEVKNCGPKPFRFFNFWMQHSSFKPFVASKEKIETSQRRIKSVERTNF